MLQNAAALLGLLILLGHVWPAQAYPLAGAIGAVAILFVLLLTGAIAGWAKSDLRPVTLPSAAFALFLVWVWGRTLFSAVPAEGWAELGNYVEGVMVFWIAATLTAARNRLDSTRHLRPEQVFALLLAGLAVAHSVHAVLQYHVFYARTLADLQEQYASGRDDATLRGILHALEVKRTGSTFGNANVLCGLLAVCLPFLFGAWQACCGQWRSAARVLIFCAFLLVMYAAFLTGSAGGMLVLSLSLVASVVFAARGMRAQARAAATLALIAFLVLSTGASERSAGAQETATATLSGSQGPGALAAVPAQESASDSFLGHLRQIKTVRQRLYYWQSGWGMWKQSPIAGNGLGSFALLYPRFHILGAGETRYAHNFVVHLAAETGLLGLVLMFLFVGLVLRRGLAGFRGLHSSPWRWAFLLALVAFLVDSLGEYIFHVREAFLDFSLIAGIVVGLAPTEKSAHPIRPVISWTLFAAIVLGSIGGLSMVVVPDRMARDYLRKNEDLWRILDSESPGGREVRALTQQVYETAERARAWEPRNALYWQKRSHALALTGRVDLAIRDAEKAAELNPYSASIRANLAHLYLRQGDREAALEWATKAVALYPLNPAHHALRAEILAESGRLEEAVQEAREAVRVSFYDEDRARYAAKLAEVQARAAKKR